MRKKGKTILMLALALLVAATVCPDARGEQGGAETITLTIDRAVMPVTLYHPGLLWTEPATVTVQDFVIRDYFGVPIDEFTIQKASARVKIPIESVKEIRQTDWICRNTGDIPRVAYIVPVVITLTDGSELETLMNADFGAIEGMTETGPFYLQDPHTVTRLVFNR